MPETTLDPELNAIQTVVNALEPLNTDARQRVITYVFQRLNLAIDQQIAPSGRGESPLTTALVPPVNTTLPGIMDIRTLKEQKAPNSDTEMAAVIAYYLSELAPSDLRKDAISKRDIDNYFKQANFPLPNNSKYTLPNAAKAGYFDALGEGQYRLNPVGFNLVAHGLPTKHKSK